MIGDAIKDNDSMFQLSWPRGWTSVDIQRISFDGETVATTTEKTLFVYS